MKFTSNIIVALLAASTSTVAATRESFNLRGGSKHQEEKERNLRGLMDDGSSPFKPATWTIDAWDTGTDNAAILCYGICKPTTSPNYEECKKGALAGTHAGYGEELPFDGCSKNSDGGASPNPNVNAGTFPSNTTWSFDTVYPTFLDGPASGFDYPNGAKPYCSTGTANTKWIENGEVRQQQWIDNIHTQVADTSTEQQFVCIADPNDPSKRLKAMVANGHGPGACGTVSVWATSADPSTNADRVVVSMQTGTRNWSTELTAQQYFDEVLPLPNHGGGGWFQPYRLDTSDITWDCTEGNCDTFPSTNDVEWTRIPASGVCENQTN